MKIKKNIFNLQKYVKQIWQNKIFISTCNVPTFDKQAMGEDWSG